MFCLQSIKMRQLPEAAMKRPQGEILAICVVPKYVSTVARTSPLRSQIIKSFVFPQVIIKRPLQAISIPTMSSWWRFNYFNIKVINNYCNNLNFYSKRWVKAYFWKLEDESRWRKKSIGFFPESIDLDIITQRFVDNKRLAIRRNSDICRKIIINVNPKRFTLLWRQVLGTPNLNCSIWNK